MRGRAVQHGRDATPGSARRRHLQIQALERALDVAQRARRDLAVQRGGVELGVAEQHLDDADVDLALEQMGRERVAIIPISE